LVVFPAVASWFDSRFVLRWIQFVYAADTTCGFAVATGYATRAATRFGLPHTAHTLHTVSARFARLPHVRTRRITAAGASHAFTLVTALRFAVGTAAQFYHGSRVVVYTPVTFLAFLFLAFAVCGLPRTTLRAAPHWLVHMTFYTFDQLHTYTFTYIHIYWLFRLDCLWFVLYVYRLQLPGCYTRLRIHTFYGSYSTRIYTPTRVVAYTRLVLLYV